MSEIKQLTREEAIALYDSEEWASWTDEKIAEFQLFQKHLCVPWKHFHRAVEKVLGRPVWTHEFADVKRLRAEFKKERPKPSFADIMEQLPDDKPVTFVLVD